MAAPVPVCGQDCRWVGWDARITTSMAGVASPPPGVSVTLLFATLMWHILHKHMIQIVSIHKIVSGHVQDKIEDKTTGDLPSGPQIHFKADYLDGEYWMIWKARLLEKLQPADHIPLPNLKAGSYHFGKQASQNQKRKQQK